MTVINPTTTLAIPGESGRDGWLMQWQNVPSGANSGMPLGSPVPGVTNGVGQIAGHADRSVQVVGTFGAGMSVVIEGSNDGVNWSQLTTPSGQPGAYGIPTAAAFSVSTGPGIMALTEACVLYRWRSSGGDGTTNLTINMFARKTQIP